MTPKNTKNTDSPNGRQQLQRTNGDSIRWIAGLVLLCIGIYAASAVFFSFFSWAPDQSGLDKTPEERQLLGLEPENLCGWGGAWLGRLLVDYSFGVFGILLPVIIILTGVRIIRQRPLLLNHSALALLLIMILGSLTLGFACADRWSLCSSTGWGGAFGIGIANLLDMRIGAFGMLILLVGGWILTGVFINRNFINTVNEAGNAVVDQSERLVGSVLKKVTHAHSGEEPVGEKPETAEAAAAQPAAAESQDVRRPAADSAAPHRTEPADRRRPEPAAETVRRPESTAPQRSEANDIVVIRGERTDAAERHPFPEERTETAQGQDIIRTESDPEVRNRPERSAAADEDDIFTAIDLSPEREARVVMGPGGLVELERRPAAAPEEEPFDAASDDPFTTVIVEPEAGHPAAGERQADEAEPESGVSDREAGGLNREAGILNREAGPAAGASAANGADYGPARGAAYGSEAGSEFSAESGSEFSAESGSEEFSAVRVGASAGSGAEEGIVVTVEAKHDRLADEHAIPTDSYDPLKDLVNYRKPPVTLLEDYMSDSEVSDEEIYENKSKIEETLKYFGIPIQRIKATVGPTVTLYEIVQAQGVKISKIQGLENDIAQSLKALGIRIIAPIPGKGTIGIEVPNHHKQVVSMYSAVRSLRFQESKAELPVVIGRTIQNENYVFDLAKMPHLLVAGATGQGKSVGLNAIITSLLYRKHPAQLKFVMIDPKMVEFSLYAKIERHFLARMESEEKSIITDPMKAVYTLNSLCTEMDNRLELCSRAGARNIVEYNENFTSRRLNPEKGHRYRPYIVVVVDEFADLIMMAREVERPVMRLAQKARAIGIHLIIATQRPDVKVITGGIKANFPARIAFRVMQMIDSRTIIDQPGANQLIGRGDMLFSKDGELTRIQCALVETREVERIVDYISRQPGYTEPYLLPDYPPEGGAGGGMGSEESSAPQKYDSLFAEIARDAVSSGQISTSMIQRNYEVGFNRAGRIMMQLERAGIVGRQQGAKPRDILFHDSPSLEAKLQDLGVF